MTPAIETVEALDEMRAREIVTVSYGAVEPSRALMLARAIRESDERAGLVVVPCEPTAAMAEAYEQHCGWVLGLHSWEAALSASPFASAAQGEGE